MVFKKILLEGDAAVLSDTAPVDTDFAIASAGTASDAARRDHKHDLNEGVVGTIKPTDGTAAALGTNDAVPHLDHIHPLGPLVANLDFAKKEATSLALDNQASDPSTPVSGQIYYKTGDGHPYIFQS